MTSMVNYLKNLMIQIFFRYLSENNIMLVRRKLQHLNMYCIVVPRSSVRILTVWKLRPAAGYCFDLSARDEVQNVKSLQTDIQMDAEQQHTRKAPESINGSNKHKWDD